MQAIGLLIGFGLQFLLGMTLNLFVQLPSVHPGTVGGEYFSQSWNSLVWALSFGGGWALFLHVLVALLLFAGCLGLFISGLTKHDKVWSWSGGVATFFTLGALFNGLSFVDYNHDFSSMIMATCWVVAVGALVFGMIKVSQKAAHRE